MKAGRFVIACLVLFVLALGWNGLVHLVLLRGANAAVEHLHRPDLSARMWQSLLVTAGVVVLFTWGYRHVGRSGSLREALGYGLFFAALAGVLVDLNQYVLYPIPGRLALLWFLGGIVEFGLYALVLRRMLPPPTAE